MGEIFDIDILFSSIVKKFYEAMNIVFEQGLVRAARIITDKLTTKEVETDKLCIGQTCVTEQELKALLQRSGISGSTPEFTPEPESELTPEPKLSPEVEPQTTPEVQPQSEPSPSESPTPEPEPTPEPTPEPSPEIIQETTPEPTPET